jgi:uncharacterized protein (TIGR00369 family)
MAPTPDQPEPFDQRSVPGRQPGQNSELVRFLGLRWLDVGTVGLTIRPGLVNDYGLLLGPVGFALVDYSMGSALWAQTNDGERIATINIAINYIQSANRGEVICTSQLDRRNRHVAVLSSRTHHEDGRLLATAVGSFAIIGPRPR